MAAVQAVLAGGRRAEEVARGDDGKRPGGGAPVDADGPDRSGAGGDRAARVAEGVGPRWQ